MRFQQPIEINERMENVLPLIETGKYLTRSHSEEISVFIPTILRIVAVLCERGHATQTVRNEN
jgi:hypothetical protein